MTERTPPPLIMHVNSTFNSRSGSARRTLSIMNGCVQAGYRVHLVCGQSNDIRPDDYPFPVTVVDTLVKPVSPFNDFKALYALRRLYRQHQPAIVHTHLAKAGALGRMATRKTDVKHVVHTVHGPSFPDNIHPLKRAVFRRIERALAPLTESMVFVGEELREQYASAGVQGHTHNVVIPTASPPAFLNVPRLSDDERANLRLALTDNTPAQLLLIQIGRLVQAKRQQHGIDVTRELRQRGIDAHLCLIGEALVEGEKRYREQLVEHARAQGMSEYIHFAGFRSDIIESLQAADIALLTSRYEGLPNVAVEAMIARTPLVTYAVSGVEETVPAALIVPIGDSAAMTRVVEQLHRGQLDITTELAERQDTMRRTRHSDYMVDLKLAHYQELLGAVGVAVGVKS